MSSTATTDINTDNTISNKKKQNEGEDFYNTVVTYIIQCVIQIIIFFALLYIVGNTFLFNCKIAQSGILSNTTSSDSFCSPFINNSINPETNADINVDHSNYDDLKGAIFSAARGSTNEPNYIATDQITFTDTNYRVYTWGQIISFDYVDNVIKETGSTTHHLYSWITKGILGYNVEKSITRISDSEGREMYSSLGGSFLSIIRTIASYDYIIVNYLFKSLGCLPEAVVFILPALLSLYFYQIWIIIIYIIWIFNLFLIIILSFVHFIEFIKYMFFYFWSTTKSMGGLQFFFFIIINLILLFIFGFFIFILFLLFGIGYILLLSFISSFLIFYILFVPAFTFQAKLYKLSDPNPNNGQDPLPNIKAKFKDTESIENSIKDISSKINSNDGRSDNLVFKDTEKGYSINTMFSQNIRFKFNWIIMTVLFVLLINVFQHFKNFNMLNYVCITLIIIFILSITHKNEIITDVNPGKSYGIKYNANDMIDNYFIPITDNYKKNYSNKYKCDNLESTAKGEYISPYIKIVQPKIIVTTDIISDSAPSPSPSPSP